MAAEVVGAPGSAVDEDGLEAVALPSAGVIPTKSSRFNGEEEEDEKEEVLHDVCRKKERDFRGNEKKKMATTKGLVVEYFDMVIVQSTQYIWSTNERMTIRFTIRCSGNWTPPPNN